jgi:hypothetical protein
MDPRLLAVGVLGVALALLIAAPVALPLDLSGARDGGVEVQVVTHDDKATFQHTHRSSFTLPATFAVDTRAGELGHVAYGLLELGKLGDYDAVAMRLKLNGAAVGADDGSARISIATQWLIDSGERGRAEDYRYLEFDVWHSPAWSPAVPLTRLNTFAELQGMPTIEVKVDQLAVGEEREYMIDAAELFARYYPGTSATLEGVYLVIGQGAGMSFEASVTLERMVLY